MRSAPSEKSSVDWEVLKDFYLNLPRNGYRGRDCKRADSVPDITREEWEATHPKIRGFIQEHPKGLKPSRKSSTLIPATPPSRPPLTLPAACPIETFEPETSGRTERPQRVSPGSPSNGRCQHRCRALPSAMLGMRSWAVNFGWNEVGHPPSSLGTPANASGGDGAPASPSLLPRLRPRFSGSVAIRGPSRSIWATAHSDGWLVGWLLPPEPAAM